MNRAVRRCLLRVSSQRRNAHVILGTRSTMNILPPVAPIPNSTNQRLASCRLRQRGGKETQDVSPLQLAIIKSTRVRAPSEWLPFALQETSLRNLSSGHDECCRNPNSFHTISPCTKDLLQDGIIPVLVPEGISVGYRRVVRLIECKKEVQW